MGHCRKFFSDFKLPRSLGLMARGAQKLLAWSAAAKLPPFNLATSRNHEFVGGAGKGGRFAAVLHGTSPQEPKELCRRNRVAGENACGVFHAQVARGLFGKDVAEIGCQRQGAPFVELMLLEPGPPAVDPSTLYRHTQNKHGAGMTVVRAAIAVFSDDAPDLRHGEHGDVRRSREFPTC